MKPPPNFPAWTSPNKKVVEVHHFQWSFDLPIDRIRWRGGEQGVGSAVVREWMEPWPMKDVDPKIETSIFSFGEF